jgi:hypothetical protein
MKLTLAFCALALVAGRQTFGVDNPALFNVPAADLDAKCVGFGDTQTVDSYEFNQQDNWSGDNTVYQGWEKVNVDFQWQTQHLRWGGYYNTNQRPSWCRSYRNERVLTGWNWQVVRYVTQRYTCNCRTYWSCSWRRGCRRKRRCSTCTRRVPIYGWVPQYRTYSYCYTQWETRTHNDSADFAAGYCGFLYMGGDRVWINWGTAVDKIIAEGGSARLVNGKRITGINEDARDLAYTCQITSVKTYHKPEHKCRISMEVGDWDLSNGPSVGGLTPGSSEIGSTNYNSQKESDDGTCIGAVAGDDILARTCMMNDGAGRITTPWFMSDDAWSVKLESITDHQGELYYHDSV